MSVFILKNVKKSFVVDKKDHVILSDVNITFPDLGLVSIIGKSGSGKSTLLNLLMGIEKPTSGKVLFLRKDISKFNDKKFSKFHLDGVSTIFQHYNLFEDLTAIENVLIPLKMKGLSRKKAKQKATDEFVKLGLEKLANRKVSTLSGGEKQRVAIMRALVTKPKVLLCDEPTGALDSKNSKEIMGILKNLSQNLLVIMVSHNRELVDAFSDYVIEIKDGKILHSSFKENSSIEIKKVKQKTRYTSNWISLFLKSNLKKNVGKNLFSVFACSIGFASVFLCVGFLVGSEKSYNEALAKNLSLGNATVSKIEYVEITDSPLTYQKSVRPEIYEVDEEFKSFSTVRIEENISYFISNCASCVFGDKNITGFQMIPLYDFSLKSYGSDLLISGTGSDNNFEKIIVNEEFANLLGKNCLNKKLIIRNSASTNYKTFDSSNPFIKDELNIEQTMEIVGIVKEFPFLNSPKIYYSYFGGRDFLKSERMENLSSYLGYSYSFYDYVLNCEPDDAVSSYSSYIFLTSLDESEEFYSKIKNLNNKMLEITSTVSDIKETYVTFISSFSKTLFMFSFIAFIAINFIIGMISLSSFLENKKNIAILTCLGSRNSSIYNLHLMENYIVIGISFIASVALSFYVQNVLNPYLSSKFALSNLITIPFESFLGFRYGLFFIFSIVVVLVSTVFTLLPMIFYRHGFITEELRDE